VRGRTKKQASMLAFIDPETLIPADHPLRTIKRFADAALVELSPLFDEMYAADGQGRASIPPERLLKAGLLISLYSVRSERAFCEELTYHLLFRWFLDMDLLEPSFDHSTFSKNRARLLRHRVSREFFDAVVLQADRLHLLSAVDLSIYCRGVAVKPDEPGTVFVAIGDSTPGRTGALMRSTDSGRTWEQLELPVAPNSAMWVVDVQIEDPRLMLAASRYGYLYRSTDGGESWTKLWREFSEVSSLVSTPG
jgi:transposase